MSERPPQAYRYGPSRAFVWIVGVAVAAQVWWALPESSGSSDTAELERVIYGELQRQRAVSDIRCTRLSREKANCVVTLPDLGRARLTADIDANSGAVTWRLLLTAPTTVFLQKGLAAGMYVEALSDPSLKQLRVAA